MKKQLIGQIQRPGAKPENVRIITETTDPLDYKIRYLPVSSASGTLTLNIADSQAISCTLSENVTTVDVDGPMVTGEHWEFELKLIQDSSDRTVTWASKFRFPGSTDHVMSTGSGVYDRLRFVSDDGGTTWDITFAQAFG